MATRFAAALLVPLIIALLTAKAPPLATADPPPRPPVLTGSKEPLLKGVKYYIVSAIWGAGGGGLNLAPVRNKSCPLDVVQEQSDLRKGLPVTFSPLNPAYPGDGQIRESSLLNIKFAASTTCVQSTVWRVVKDEHQQWVVTTGGIEGITEKSSASLFKIEKNDMYSYKIVYCSSPITNKCRDVGLYFNRGIRGLTLSDKPLRVVFFKAQ